MTADFKAVLPALEGIDQVANKLATSLAQAYQAIVETYQIAADAKAIAANLKVTLSKTENVEDLVKLRFEELCLAAAMLAGDHQALVELSNRITEQLAMGHKKLRLSPDRVDEVKQRLMTELTTDRNGLDPALMNYSGRGNFNGWLRIVTLRAAMKLIGANKKEVGVEQRVFENIFADDHDPEVNYLRQHYRGEFKEAFRKSVAQLSARERNLLRQSLIDGLTVSQLGKLYGTHRATAARWVAAAREKLADRTKSRLKDKLGVNSLEYQSILELIHSQLDLTFRSLHQTDAEEPPSD